MNDYIEVVLKSAIGVLTASFVSVFLIYFSFLITLKRKISDIQEKFFMYDEKFSVVLYTLAALYDKTFKGVENGRKAKAEELLNKILFKTE